MVRLYQKHQCKYYYSKMRENRYYKYTNKKIEVKCVTVVKIEDHDKFKLRTID